MSIVLPSDEMRFAQSLSDMRQERGWSQSELARQMVEAGWSTYSQMTVSRTEKGERSVRLGEARALATLLGSSVDRMVGDTNFEAALRDLEIAARNLEASGDALWQAQQAVRTALTAAKRARRAWERAYADAMSRGALHEELDDAMRKQAMFQFDLIALELKRTEERLPAHMRSGYLDRTREEDDDDGERQAEA